MKVLKILHLKLFAPACQTACMRMKKYISECLGDGCNPITWMVSESASSSSDDVTTGSSFFSREWE